MTKLLALALGVVAAGVTTQGLSSRVTPDSRPDPAPAAAAAQATPWVMPRTPDGRPDLQGNWTNETQTPLERMGTTSATLTKEQAEAIEERARLVAEFRDQPSDPNRPTPPKGDGHSRTVRRSSRLPLAPTARRHAGNAFEGTVERGFRLVADVSSDRGETVVAF